MHEFDTMGAEVHVHVHAHLYLVSCPAYYEYGKGSHASSCCGTCEFVLVQTETKYFVADASLGVKCLYCACKYTQCVCLVQAQDFRRSALAVCERAVTERASSQSTAMRYYYPPNLLDYQPRVDQSNSEISVSVDFLSSDGTRYGTTIQARPLYTV